MILHIFTDSVRHIHKTTTTTTTATATATTTTTITTTTATCKSQITDLSASAFDEEQHFLKILLGIWFRYLLIIALNALLKDK